MKFYVYEHYANNENLPFYVGKGLKARPYAKKSRNRRWNSIVKKYGRTVKIVFENLTNEEALSQERKLIEKYKKLGGCRANFTLGGSGALGFKFSKDQIKSRLIGNSFKLGHKASEASKLKMSKAKLGSKQSEAHKLAIAQANNGGRNFKVIDKKDKVIWQGSLISKCAKDLSLVVANIHRCLKGERKSHKNYRIVYEG